VCLQTEKVASPLHEVVRLGKEVQRVDHYHLGLVEHAQLLEQVGHDNPRRACRLIMSLNDPPASHTNNTQGIAGATYLCYPTGKAAASRGEK